MHKKRNFKVSGGPNNICMKLIIFYPRNVLVLVPLKKNGIINLREKLREVNKAQYVLFQRFNLKYVKIREFIHCKH